MIYAILAVALIGVIIIFRTFGMAVLQSRTDREAGRTLRARNRIALLLTLWFGVLVMMIGTYAGVLIIRVVGAIAIFSAPLIVIIGTVFENREERNESEK